MCADRLRFSSHLGCAAGWIGDTVTERERDAASCYCRLQYVRCMGRACLGTKPQIDFDCEAAVIGTAEDMLTDFQQLQMMTVGRKDDHF